MLIKKTQMKMDEAFDISNLKYQIPNLSGHHLPFHHHFTLYQEAKCSDVTQLLFC